MSNNNYQTEASDDGSAVAAKARHIATVVCFALVLVGLSVAFVVIPDAPFSRAERRALAQLPALTSSSILGGSYQEQFDTYAQDQFPWRDGFRTVNALFRRYVLQQKDYNGYYLANGQLSKIEYPLNTDTVKANAAWLDNIASHYLAGMNVYYSIVPDKNYFLAAPNGYLSMDYQSLVDTVKQQMNHATYIDIFKDLSLADYYRTDIHWRQESIAPVAQHLAQVMGVPIPSSDQCSNHTLAPFYGSFYRSAALPVRPDQLNYCSNQYTDNAVVNVLNGQLDMTNTVSFDGAPLKLATYNPALFDGIDSYDTFLAGAQAIVTIDVPNAKTDRQLIVFRDSFASSLAPLLLGGYSKITLVDIRYISSRQLPNFVTFDNQDVLFLYSTSILNRSGLFQ